MLRQARFVKRRIMGFPVPRHVRLASRIRNSRLFKNEQIDSRPWGDSTCDDLRPGEIVWVRSREEIDRTLDGNRMLKGCQFMPEMYRFCGTKQVVFKRVRKFLDEGEKIMRRAKNIYLLENVICLGTHGFEECDRSCFFFWRSEWLDRRPTEPGGDA